MEAAMCVLFARAKMEILHSTSGFPTRRIRRRFRQRGVCADLGNPGRSEACLLFPRPHEVKSRHGLLTGEGSARQAPPSQVRRMPPRSERREKQKVRRTSMRTCKSGESVDAGTAALYG